MLALVALAALAGTVGEDLALSPHARTSFVFESAVKREDPRWCVSCHQAPSSCDSCHRADVDVRSPLLCARCHQFGFLRRDVAGAVIGTTDAAVARDAQQNTYAEWLAWTRSPSPSHSPAPASPAASQPAPTCQACHMREGHTFGGVRRTAALAAALEIDRLPGRRLRISARAVGHELPTGDVMRWISVEVASTEAFDDVVVVAKLRRDLALVDGGAGFAPRLAVVADHRIPARGFVDVDVPAAARFWRVIYHLVSEEQEATGLIPVDISRIEVRKGAIE